MTILYLCLIGLALGIAIRFISGLLGGVVRVALWVKLLAVVIAIVTVYAAFVKFQDLESYWARRSWPATDAVIVSSDIEGERAYRPIIAFQYTVGDSLYIDTTDLNPPGFGNKRRRLEVAETWVREYPPGKQITVSYNPRDPKTAYVSLTPPWTDLFIPGLGVFCALVAGFLIACPVRRLSG